MKKQVFALTLCLALTTACALANETINSNKSLPTSVKTEKQKLPICPCKFMPSCDNKLPPEQMKKQFEEKMAKHRENFYLKLGLTEEQKLQAKKLDLKNREDGKILRDKFHEECFKLRDLKEKKANKINIYMQEQRVKSAQKALEKHMEASKKSFEAILTKEQLEKLKVIEAKRNKQMGKRRKNHPTNTKKQNSHGQSKAADFPEPPFPTPFPPSNK